MSKLINKVSISVVSIATVLSLSGAAGLIPTVQAAALSTAQISAIVSLLQSFGADSTTIANVQTSLSGGTLSTTVTTGTSTTVSSTLLSSSDLTVGSKGAAVMELQKFLNANGYTVSASGAGSMGNESSYFGNATRAALAKFQAARNITPAAGYFGAKSRAALQSMSSTTTTTGSTTTTTTTTTTTASGAAMSAVLASAQPTGTLAPKNAARVPFTTVTLTAGSSDVTVNTLTVQRMGVAMDAAFDGLVLVDSNGLQIGDAKTLNSNHQANIGSAFVIKAGSSKTVTVAANMASSLASYDGQVASFEVVAVNTADGSTFSGLPLTGVSLRLVDNITLGSVTTAVSSYDPASANSQQIGTTGYKFAALRITAGSAEKVKLMSIRFNQSGSVSSSDFANLQVMVDSTAYAVTADSTGKYFSATFGNGLLIDKGLSKDIWIQGDIVGTNASNRTIQFDIYKTTDVYMIGDTYGYGIIPAAGLGTYDSTHATTQLTTSNPWFQSSAITITAGSATAVSKALSVPSANIAVNVPNQVLGGFDTDIKGEGLSVQKMYFSVASTTGSGYGLLTSVSLYQGNTVVAGPVDAVYLDSTHQILKFTDTVTIPVGKTTYTIKGKVASTIGNNGTYAITTIPSSGAADTVAGWSNITGGTTGNTISLSSIGSLTMNTMTVKGAALAVYVSSTPAAQTIVAPRQSLTFANIQLDATQSGEDIRMSTISLYSTGTTTDMTSCQIFDGATALTTGSNVWTATTAATASTKKSFTLDNSLTVAKGTVKTLSLVCNVKALAASIYGTNGLQNVYKWGLPAAGTITTDWSAVTGVTSGTTVSVTGTQNAGNAMTVGASSFTVAADSSSPSYALAYGGQTGVAMGVLKFHAASEPMTLHDIALKLTSATTPAASSTSADLVQATLWNSAGTQVGSLTFSGANTVATSTLTTPITVPSDGDASLTVKVDLGSIGSGLAAHQGALVILDLNAAVASKTQSGGDVYSTGTTAFSGVRLFRAVPVFAKLSGVDTALSQGTVTGRELYRFSVTATPSIANGGNGIGLDRLKLNIATSSANDVSGSTTVSSVVVYAYTDSGLSNPVSGYTSGAISTLTSPAMSGDNTMAISPILEIPAGSTYYFKVTGTVTNTAGSGTFSGSIATKITQDTLYPSLSPVISTYNDGLSLMGGVATTGVAASALIWSPNATSTSVAGSDDWTNGYQLPGLSGADMTTALTISK